MSPILRLSLLLALSNCLGGCGFFSGVSVKTNGVQASQPSKVLIQFSVDERDEPIDYLDESNLSIYETDVLLDSKGIGLRLLPRETNAVGHTVLLLDLSGAANSTELEKLERGASHFVEKVTTTQEVTVLAYDGGDRVRLVGNFPRVSAASAPTITLDAFSSGDDSRDLNGAVLQALDILKSELAEETKPIRLGTLVVHARGPDLAGRKPESDLRAALDDDSVDHFVITPEESNVPVEGDLGATAAFHYENADDLPLRFQDLGMRVRKSWGRHYLLSYCSPARAGSRTVTVKVRYLDEDGAERSGSGDAEFSAEGFTAGCKPSVVPTAPVTMSVEPVVEPTPAPVEPTVEATPKKKKSPPAKKKATPTEAAPTAPEAPDDDVVAPPSSGKYK